jgi:hypothetical protein
MSSLSLKVESDEVVVQLNENKENSDFQIIESAEEKKEENNRDEKKRGVCHGFSRCIIVSWSGILNCFEGCLRGASTTCIACSGFAMTCHNCLESIDCDRT